MINRKFLAARWAAAPVALLLSPIALAVQDGPISGPQSNFFGKAGVICQPPSNGGPCMATGLVSGCCEGGASELPAGGDCFSDGGGGAGGPGSAGGAGSTGAGSFPDHIMVDAVLRQSGQEMWQESDLVLQGLDHGVGLSLMRRHLSMFGSRDQVGLHDGVALYHPMFGMAWSCNLQRFLWRIPNGASPLGDQIFEEGFDRVSSFQRVADTKVWDGILDTTDKVIWDESSPFAPRIWRTGGLELVFSDFQSDGNGREVARLELIRSPNGNTITFRYGHDSDITNPAWHQISQIEDSYGARTPSGGRVITFGYSTFGGKRVVTQIQDFDGRVLNYEYEDENGNQDGGDFLRKAISFAAPGFTGVNRPTTTYGYDHRTDSRPTLKYNLGEVVAPNQNQTQAGSDPHRAAWTYAVSGNFVGALESHESGDQTADPEIRAGGETELTYALDSNAQFGDHVRATMETARGVTVSYGMSYAGQMLFERFDGWSQGTPRLAPGSVRTFAITSEGNLESSSGVMGDRLDVRYADSASDPAVGYSSVYVNTQRAAAGLRTWAKRTPDAGRPSDQSAIVVETIYEPVFNRPFQSRDARGNVTTYIYDYMEDLDASLAHLEVCLGYDGDTYWLTDPANPNSVSQLRQMFDDMVAGAWVDVSGDIDSGDVNGDGFGAGNPATCGLVVKIIHPEVTLPSQAALYSFGNAPIATTQSAFELMRYNDFGQMVWRQDAEGNVDVLTYYPDENVAGDEVAMGSGVSGVGDGLGGGYLRSVSLDTVADPTRNSGTGGPASNVTTQYGYKVLSGSVIGAGLGQVSYSRSIKTVVIDGRGVRDDIQVNSRDQVVRIERGTDSLDPLLSVAGLGYFEELEYDANGNNTLSRIQDPNASNGATEYRFDFNILNLPVRTVGDVGGRDLTTFYTYDPSLNLIGARRVDASAPNDVNKSPLTTWSFDERSLMVGQKEGAGSPSEADNSSTVDQNGNITSWTDDSGDVHQIRFDGFDRVREIVARDGTTTSFTLDPAGNVIATAVRGGYETLTATGTIVSHSSTDLSSSRAFFDARNRKFLELQGNGYIGGPSPVGAPLPGALVANLPFGIVANGEIANMTIYDRNDRPIVEIDADGDDDEVQYDGLGRPTRLKDALDNLSRLAYDGNNNVVATLDVDLPTIGGATLQETFLSRSVFDALDRRVIELKPNQEATFYEYDSRDNVTKQTDPLGHVTEWQYDALARQTGSIQYLGSSAEGGDPNLGGVGSPDGQLTNTQTWDALGRVRTRFDDRGNRTLYAYDSLSRMVGTLYGDGTLERFFYNGDSELTAHVGQAGEIHRYSYDEVGRMKTAVHLTPAGPASDVDLRGTTRQQWTWDGAGRNWGRFDNNGPGVYNDVVVNFGYDMLGRPTGEEQFLGAGSPGTTLIRYEGADRVVEEGYPSGRTVGRSYDALDRLDEVYDIVAGVPLLPSIAEFDYVGQSRLLRVEYANGTVLDKRGVNGKTVNYAGNSNPGGYGYDANRRTLLHEWKLGGQIVAGFRSEFNGPNGVGTGRRVLEERLHVNRQDSYGFDDAYRMVSFSRQTHNGAGVVSFDNSRELDGVDKMHEFFGELSPTSNSVVNRSPEIDQHAIPGENGLNQYSSFDSDLREYDRLGSLQGEFNGKSLRFDSQTRLSRLLEGKVEVFEYAYDSDNRRIAKISTGSDAPVVVERYFYDGNWQVLEEQGPTGDWSKQYVTGDEIDSHLQYRVNFPTPAGDNWVPLYYHCNSNGFVGGMTLASGLVAEYFEYSWFGVTSFLDSSGSLLDANLGTPEIEARVTSRTGNPYLFQGRRLDPETGLYHFRHRQYDAASGSFVSVDPSGVWRHGQGNGYSAFDADPWNMSDPYGLCTAGGVDPCEKLRKKVQSLTAKIATAEATYKRKKGQIANAKAKAANLKKSIARAKRNFARTDNENWPPGHPERVAHEAHLARLQSNLAKREAEIARVGAEMNALAAKIKGLKADLKEAAAALAACEAAKKKAAKGIGKGLAKGGAGFIAKKAPIVGWAFAGCCGAYTWYKTGSFTEGCIAVIW